MYYIVSLLSIIVGSFHLRQTKHHNFINKIPTCLVCVHTWVSVVSRIRYDCLGRKFHHMQGRTLIFQHWFAHLFSEKKKYMFIVINRYIQGNIWATKYSLIFFNMFPLVQFLKRHFLSKCKTFPLNLSWIWLIFTVPLYEYREVLAPQWPSS